MEIRQLEAFAAVMTTGSVTGAARLLERSQPAITRLVQELEAEIGYALFARSGPRVTPTEQAYLLYGDVERMLGSWRSIHSRAAEVGRGGVAQPLVLAATSALAVGLVPQALHALQESFADTPLQLRSAAPEQVVHDVVNGVVQMGASSLPLDHKGLHILWMGQAPCVAVLPAGDALCDLPVVPLHALAQRRLVTMSNPYRLRHKPNAALSTNVGMGAQASDLMGPAIETNSSINAQAMVRAGLGVAILEPLTALGAPAEGVVVRPLDASVLFDFGVFFLAGRSPSSMVQALAQAMLDAARAVPGFVQLDSTESNR
jgi:DNA-binding transcriptional LysR family regulator